MPFESRELFLLLQQPSQTYTVTIGIIVLSYRLHSSEQAQLVSLVSVSYSIKVDGDEAPWSERSWGLAISPGHVTAWVILSFLGVFWKERSQTYLPRAAGHQCQSSAAGKMSIELPFDLSSEATQSHCYYILLVRSGSQTSPN